MAPAQASGRARARESSFTNCFPLLLKRCSVLPSRNVHLCECCECMSPASSNTGQKDREGKGCEIALTHDYCLDLMAWKTVPKAIIPCVLSEAAIAVVEVRATR